MRGASCNRASPGCYDRCGVGTRTRKFRRRGARCCRFSARKPALTVSYDFHIFPPRQRDNPRFFRPLWGIVRHGRQRGRNAIRSNLRGCSRRQNASPPVDHLAAFELSAATNSHRATTGRINLGGLLQNISARRRRGFNRFRRRCSSGHRRRCRLRATNHVEGSQGRKSLRPRGAVRRHGGRRPLRYIGRPVNASPWRRTTGPTPFDRSRPIAPGNKWSPLPPWDPFVPGAFFVGGQPEENRATVRGWNHEGTNLSRSISRPWRLPA